MCIIYTIFSGPSGVRVNFIAIAIKIIPKKLAKNDIAPFMGYNAAVVGREVYNTVEVKST